MTDPSEFRLFLRGLMPRLGDMARLGFENPGPVTYKRPGNPVTEIDRAIEAVAIEAIRGAWPDHGIEGEESDPLAGTGSYRWFIDPIDGTMNFIRGIPFFSVSIGVTHGNDVVAGAVLDPLRRELFHTARGDGAYRDEDPISLGHAPVLAEAALSIQLSDRGRFLRMPGFMRELHRRCQKTRKLGTIALELAYVACGRMDLLLAGKGSPQAWWDIAGGWALVEEAGGRVVDLDDRPLTQQSTHLLAGRAELIDETLALIREFE